MRYLLSALCIGATCASPAGAIGDLASFERIHTECVSAGEVSFGPQGSWSDCRIGKGRWFSTIGHIDFYQAQYCLGSGGEGCAQRALLLFANRAYTPVAKMILGRVDPGDTEYADPLVRQTPYGRVLAIEAQRPGRPAERSYYLWRDDHWQAIDTVGWRRDLLRRLPPGVALRDEPLPDFDDMRVEAGLLRRRDRAAGSAEIELGLVNARLSLKALHVVMPSAR
ncbi:MAG: hypothetical protein HYU74_02195 [Dechloromonas sp.]|nr:hypothetical protein [Dechloromonas sp.]